MSVPGQLVDTSDGMPEGIPTSFMSPQDRAAVYNTQDTSPEETVAQYQQNRERDTQWVEKVELDRIMQENRAMQERLGQTTEQLNQNAQLTANLQGQLSQMNQTSQAEQARAAAEAQFALTPEEMEAHAEVLPLAEKIAGRQTWEMEQRMQAEIDRRVSEALQNATAPIQEKLQQTEQQLNTQAQITTNQFNSALAQQVSSMGLPSINDIVQMPEFTQGWFNEPVGPGIQTAKGDLLKEKIVAQDLNGAQELLRDFRDNHTNLQPQANTAQVPGGSRPPRQQPNASSNQNLSERQRLTAQLQKRQEDFTRGNLPPGWTKPKYIAEQQKLRDKIALIPTT